MTICSSEKRLARVLLLVSNFGKERQPEPVIAKTHCSVSFFMNRFRKPGFIEYNGGIHVHNSLLNIVLHD